MYLSKGNELSIFCRCISADNSYTQTECVILPSLYKALDQNRRLRPRPRRASLRSPPPALWLRTWTYVSYCVKCFVAINAV